MMRYTGSDYGSRFTPGEMIEALRRVRKSFGNEFYDKGRHYEDETSQNQPEHGNPGELEEKASAFSELFHAELEKRRETINQVTRFEPRVLDFSRHNPYSGQYAEKKDDKPASE